MKSLLSRRWFCWACLPVLVLGVLASGCRQTRKLLREPPVFSEHIDILIWKNYLPPEVIFDFQDEFGIQVVVEYLESNDEVMNKLAKKRYDIAMPSSFKAKEMFGLGALAALDPANIPNLANLDTVAYNSKFDLTNRFMVPYIWGSTGIGYRSDAVDGIPKSWVSLFGEPKTEATDIIVPATSSATAPLPTATAKIDARTTSDKHTSHSKARRIAVLDDARFTLGCALIYLKHPLDTAGEPEIIEAGELIKSIADTIVYIDGDNVSGMLARNELEMDMVMAWSGDATRAMRGFSAPDETQRNTNPKKENVFVKNTQVRLSLPAEGTLLFRDSFVVPVGARNQSGAEKFINYLLRPDVAGRVTNYSDYANTLRREKVMPYIDRFIVNSASYFTNPAGSRFNFTFDDIPAQMEPIYRRVWADVKKATKQEIYPEIKAGLYPPYPPPRN